jgi:hypothetical protein
VAVTGVLGAGLRRAAQSVLAWRVGPGPAVSDVLIVLRVGMRAETVPLGPARRDLAGLLALQRTRS